MMLAGRGRAGLGGGHGLRGLEADTGCVAVGPPPAHPTTRPTCLSTALRPPHTPFPPPPPLHPTVPHVNSVALSYSTAFSLARVALLRLAMSMGGGDGGRGGRRCCACKVAGAAQRRAVGTAAAGQRAGRGQQQAQDAGPVAADPPSPSNTCLHCCSHIPPGCHRRGGVGRGRWRRGWHPCVGLGRGLSRWGLLASTARPRCPSRGWRPRHPDRPAAGLWRWAGPGGGHKAAAAAGAAGIAAGRQLGSSPLGQHLRCGLLRC